MNRYFCLIMVSVLVFVFGGTAFCDTVTVTAETDRPVIVSGETQIVYLRVGLKGCKPEIIEDRPAVNTAIVIDRSGSMAGEKIEKAKEAAILALHRLDERDIVSVVLYDSDVEVLVPATRMTDRNDIIKKIRQINSGGSTALYDGVKQGADEVRKFKKAYETVNRVVLLSDGLANIGPDSPSELGKLGGKLVEEGISVTTIGLGTGYNEDLMSQLAYKSDGGHYFAKTADELAGTFDQEFGRAVSIVAQDVEIEVICGEGIRPVRMLGREAVIKGRSVKMDVQNVFGNHEKYAILELEVPTKMMSLSEHELAAVSVKYKDMQSNTQQQASRVCNIRVSESSEEAEKSLNKKVLADAVEQIAVLNNQRALELRDEGNVNEARRVLNDNVKYLNSYGGMLGSSRLTEYAGENSGDAQNLGGSSWSLRRKEMRESQSTRQTQR